MKTGTAFPALSKQALLSTVCCFVLAIPAALAQQADAFHEHEGDSIPTTNTMPGPSGAAISAIRTAQVPSMPSIPETQPSFSRNGFSPRPATYPPRPPSRPAQCTCRTGAAISTASMRKPAKLSGATRFPNTRAMQGRCPGPVPRSAARRL